jgi:hypothetical protein
VRDKSSRDYERDSEEAVGEFKSQPLHWERDWRTPQRELKKRSQREKHTTAGYEARIGEFDVRKETKQQKVGGMRQQTEHHVWYRKVFEEEQTHVDHTHRLPSRPWTARERERERDDREMRERDERELRDERDERVERWEWWD